VIELSSDQRSALDNLLVWFNDKNKSPYISLGGYAGTGKTTLVSVFRGEVNKKNKNLKVAFISYTGKAARVLKTKIVQSGSVYKQDFIGTIHSLIYSPIVNEHEVIIGWELKDEIPYELIVVDEASMVDEGIWNDLCSYGIPIIAVGDHGQLPPIEGRFNLMEKPYLRLEEIHRQAAEDPIVKLSIMARQHGFIPVGIYGKNVRKISISDGESRERLEEHLKSYKSNDLVLCGLNSTRVKLNKFIREAIGFESPIPTSGDRVICLRNNRAKEIYNGMLGRIISIKAHDKEWYKTEIRMDDEADIYEGLISIEQFGSLSPINFTDKRSRVKTGDLFDWGYALTVHKAQGSQAKRVILLEERFSKMDDDTWKRWLYTAVTRAEKALYIFGN
jgi:ATP-dependent exoDNAse (exonuclease V) alpha subunit